MVHKFEINGVTDTDVAYMKYNYTSSELVIGGHSDCIDFIDQILDEIIKKPGTKNSHKQRARLRYCVNINKAKFRKIKADLKEIYTDGFKKIDKLENRL